MSAIPVHTKQKELISANFHLKLAPGQVWYLFTTKWFNSWKEHVGFDNDTTGEPPGPIDNEPLLAFGNYLKNSLVENIDFVLLNEKVGKLLHSWYVGKEVTRRVITDGAKDVVELYPIYLLFSLFSESLHFHDAVFSRKTKLGELKSWMKSFFKIDGEIRLWLSLLGNPYHCVNDDLSVELDQVIMREVGQQVIIEVKSGGWPLDFKLTPRIIQITSNGKLVHSNHTKEISSGDGQVGKPGVVGLTNLGNTCFMNASLQCLTKIPQIKDYFLNCDWKKEVNTENQLGTNGKLAQVFADLMNGIWSGKNSVVTPKDFKLVIGRFQQQFAGSNQQDSQEFLSYLLDLLHEDLNRIVKKPNVDPPIRGSRNDIEVAKEAWDVHLKRNNSVLTDQMQGQFKSTLVCPDCQNISITFDPYTAISVPFPIQPNRSIYVTVFRVGNKEKPIKYKVTIPKDAMIKDLRKAVGEHAKIPPGQLVIAETYSSKVHRYFLDTHEVSGITVQDVMVAYEVPSLDETSHQNQYTYKLAGLEPNFISIRVFSLESTHGTTLNVKPIGTPLNIEWSSTMTNKELYDSCLSSLKRYIKKDVIDSKFDLDDSTTLFPLERGNIEQSSANFFFTLRYEAISGSHCNTLERLWYSNDVYEMDQRHYAEKRVLALMIPDKIISKYLDAGEFVGETLDTSCFTTDTNVKLDECLDLFKKEEKLSKENTWFCPTCRKHVQATKQLEIWKLPNVMVIHLKRFNLNDRIGILEKIEAPIDYPTEIDMKDYCLLSKFEDINTKYKLFGVVNHMGNINGGHYTANVLVDDKWYNFDDSRTLEIQSPTSQNAYVLFYVNTKAPLTAEIKGKIFPTKEQLEQIEKHQKDLESMKPDRQMMTDTSQFLKEH